MDSVISIGLIVIVAVVFIGAVIMEKRKTIGDCNEAYNAGNRKCNGDKLL